MNKIDSNKWKKFKYFFIIWILIFSVGLISREFQNDTFYTIKIGKLIFNNGIDMMDHFSFHVGLAYTYPHWLYDLLIYFIFNYFGYTGLYISSIVFMFIIVLLMFKTNLKITNNYIISAFTTFVGALAIGGFVTARAQTITYILFVLEIFFIESFYKSGNKKYLLGLLGISLIICNIHVAVWPFYFIVYLPYIAEYFISFVFSKIKYNNRFISFIKRKFIIEKNNNIKYLIIIMFCSLLTGFITPTPFVPFTYTIKTMLGNSQKYILEHQMITWANSPFTIIIAFETLLLSVISKVKLRDLFMTLGLCLMSIISIRHLSLLALIGTICFARTFTIFLEHYNFNVNDKLYSIISKKLVFCLLFIFVILFNIITIKLQFKKEYINKELYPVEATKYIKNNLNIKKIKLFNEYNFGSYLLLNDIPVFIDSRADLYTKQFSGFNYDIFDDYEYIVGNYQEKFNFYGITHALLYKKDNPFYDLLQFDYNYRVLYEDDYFVLFEKISDTNVVVTYATVK